MPGNTPFSVKFQRVPMPDIVSLPFVNVTVPSLYHMFFFTP